MESCSGDYQGIDVPTIDISDSPPHGAQHQPKPFVSLISQQRSAANQPANTTEQTLDPSLPFQRLSRASTSPKRQSRTQPPKEKSSKNEKPSKKRKKKRKAKRIPRRGNKASSPVVLAKPEEPHSTSPNLLPVSLSDQLADVHLHEDSKPALVSPKESIKPQSGPPAANTQTKFNPGLDRLLRRQRRPLQNVPEVAEQSDHAEEVFPVSSAGDELGKDLGLQVTGKYVDGKRQHSEENSRVECARNPREKGFRTGVGEERKEGPARQSLELRGASLKSDERRIQG